MTPEIEALIAEIDARWSQDPWSKDYLVASHIKAALREQAGEIERLKLDAVALVRDSDASHAECVALFAERDALQARVRELEQFRDWAMPQVARPIEAHVIDENNALREQIEQQRRHHENRDDSSMREINALRAENEGLRKDAERYRKVAQYVAGDEDGLFCFDVALQIREPFNTAADIKAALDSAIDDKIIEDMTP